jgi:DNA-directed RNA polymerase specialized sigma24 family protein
MVSRDVDPDQEASPEESRLVRQARAGDAAAFIQLYDSYIEGVYRHVYLQVLNNAAAERLTSQIFRYAWENLNSYQKSGSSFSTWLYGIARNQVMGYYKTSLKTHAIDVGFLSVAADYGLNKEVQDLIKLETIRSHLQFLTGDPKPTLISRVLRRKPINQKIARMMGRLEGDVHSLQVSSLQTVSRFLEHLNLGREVKPSSGFNTHTRLWLAQYLQFHAHRPAGSSTFWRMTLIYTALVAAFLITGTAKAQSALPGDILYGWKRTSEQAWLSLSPDPVGTNIILADRRLNELIAVEHDPVRRAEASSDYSAALTKLNPVSNSTTSARLLPVLRAHSQRLANAGLPAAQVNNYLTVGVASGSSVNLDPVIPTEVVPPVTEVSTAAAAIPAVVASPSTNASAGFAPPPTDIPAEVALPSTEVPTEVGLPPTAVPTEVVPLPTEVPTEVIVPATPVPTQPATLATVAPTQVAPPSTAVPTQVGSPATQVPSAVAPPATDVPSAAPPPPPPATAPSPQITNPVLPTPIPGLIPTGAIP